jgi:CRP/FNR family cyclic AMP-dependent transcriptional regulator
MKTILEQTALFRGLPDAVLDRIQLIMKRRRYAKEAIVFRKGDPGDALYAVINGSVRVSANAANADEVFLNIMQPGDSFGEIALLDGMRRTASAIALEPTELGVIDRGSFLRLLEEEPIVAIHLLQLFCERVRWTSELVEDSAFLPVPARLAKRLLYLAEHHGSEVESGIQLNMSQGHLSQFLGISRQIVSRYLHQWLENGWLELGRGKITILDPESLRTAVTSYSDERDIPSE